MKRQHRSVDLPILNLATHPSRSVTVPVLAEYLEVERDTVIRMIQRGVLLAFKVGREWRISIESAQQSFATWRE
jgi:excisionase family DNA binding protein